MNIGDVIFQLISFIAAAFFLFAVIYVFRSLKQRRIQLDRIEKKLDALREEKTKSYSSFRIRGRRSQLHLYPIRVLRVYGVMRASACIWMAVPVKHGASSGKQLFRHPVNLLS